MPLNGVNYSNPNVYFRISNLRLATVLYLQVLSIWHFFTHFDPPYPVLTLG